MKTLFILGGSSMVGSRVIELLSSQFEIIAPSSGELDLTKPGNFEQYCMDNRSKLVNATIINFVAYTNVDEAEKETGDENGLCFRLNASLPGEIAKLCTRESTGFSPERYIHISTDYVFDGEKEVSPYVEEDEVNPIGWYGKTKLIGEQYVKESGANYVTLRIEMPYGSKSEKKKDIATILLERLKNSQPIQAINDAKISPVYIDDLAEVIRKVVEQQDIVGEYHIAPTDSVTLEQFVRLIARHGKLDDSVVTTISFDEYWKEKLENGAAKRPKHSWMSSSKLQQKIGKEYFHSIDESIQSWISRLD